MLYKTRKLNLKNVSKSLGNLCLLLLSGNWVISLEVYGKLQWCYLVWGSLESTLLPLQFTLFMCVVYFDQRLGAGRNSHFQHFCCKNLKKSKKFAANFSKKQFFDICNRMLVNYFTPQKLAFFSKNTVLSTKSGCFRQTYVNFWVHDIP